MPRRRRPRGNAASLAQLRKKTQESNNNYNGCNNNNNTKENNNNSNNKTNNASGSKSSNVKNTNAKKENSNNSTKTSLKAGQQQKQQPKQTQPQPQPKKVNPSYFKKPTLAQEPNQKAIYDLELLEEESNYEQETSYDQGSICDEQYSCTDREQSFGDDELTYDIEPNSEKVESCHESTYDVSEIEMDSFCYLQSTYIDKDSCVPVPACVPVSCSEPGACCHQEIFFGRGSICHCGQEQYFNPCQLPFYDQESNNEQKPNYELETLYNREPLYNKKPRCEEEVIAELPPYIPDLLHDQEPEPTEEQPILDDQLPELSYDQSSSAPDATPEDSFAFMWGQNANGGDVKLFPELYDRMPELPSYADIFGQPSYGIDNNCMDCVGLQAACQTGGIRSTHDGQFTDIPGSMIQDQYGMLGLLSAIRTSHTNPVATQLVFGEDLTTYGLDLTALGDIYVHFNGPFTNEPPPRNCQDIDFEMSMRQMRDDIATYSSKAPAWDPFVPETGNLDLVFGNQNAEQQTAEQQEEEMLKQENPSDEEQMQQEEEREWDYDYEPFSTALAAKAEDTSTDYSSNSNSSTSSGLLSPI
ncbi:uncharacterized protein DMAD_06241 [Drosophila madeirensis]|uniref:Uncharacterized protein n=1 Tax=Drosophila madeirensis TaxID=30013 RepID=A0AAU9FPU0_DROMD